MLDELDDPNRGRSAPTRDLGDFDPARVVKERALSWGQNAINSSLNSSAEALVSGLGEHARARMNFHIDRDGKLRGEGDVLLPLYDTPRTVVFSQIGARNMNASHEKDRWIGNFGLGQRWFPDATEEDSGDWMFGYNVFFDKDFTRAHQRGGVGLELQYDWLRLAANHYFPLSGWKGSYDFDRRFVEERPARGWDARVEAFLPFYRHLALTGEFSRWAGDKVAAFGGTLEKDPKIWSYGVKYTPFPLLSGSITRRNAEGGPGDTEFGLSLTYHFGVPWHQQISPARVAELRTVSGSRYEFVERENRMFLEYRAKPGAYRIVCENPSANDKNTCEEDGEGKDDKNRFSFRVLNGFGEVENRLGVYLHEDGGGTAALEQPFTEWGKFRVQLVNPLPLGGKVRVSIQVGNTTQKFFLKGTPPVYRIEYLDFTNDCYQFRLSNDSDEIIIPQRSVQVTAQGGAWLMDGGNAVESLDTVTDDNGLFCLRLAPGSPDPTRIAVMAGNTSKTFALKDFMGTIKVTVGAFRSGISEATLKLEVVGSQSNPVTTGNVVWTITGISSNTNLAVTTAFKNSLAGLSLDGATRLMPTPTNASPNPTTVPSVTPVTKDISESVTLSDIVGERVVGVSATMSIEGSPRTFTGTVEFGDDGPLSVFRLPGGVIGAGRWADKIPVGNATSFPVAAMCDKDVTNYNYASWTAGDYSSQTNLPTRAQFQAVEYARGGNGAWLAAGWFGGNSYYWTGELLDVNQTYAIRFERENSYYQAHLNDTNGRVVCLRQ
ncbi:MAG: inverse autotransporter beta domain-containing protein [Candidatus Accumulibacter sp.]|nr:inverse autotransporter beta domain-containing protein [Accumulibacter sp.]